MTETVGFQKRYRNLTDYDIIELFENGTSRIVSSEYELYKNYTGTTTTISGNEYVIINSNGTITYDSDAELRAQNNLELITLRNVRNSKLREIDWIILRHIGQKELVNAGKLSSTTITEETFINVLTYQQALRDITQKYSSMSTVVWPINPI